MKSNITKKTISIACMFLFAMTFVFAQEEQLLPLGQNFVLKKYWADLATTKNHSAANYKLQAAGDTLSIPFVDDFSYEGIFPASNLWTDSNVFINSTFPINPPTVGVATFDGLDKYGNAYDNTNSGSPDFCDYLTSKPINLFDDGQGNPYGLTDSLCLSFFVQRKGNGNQVAANDSLIVDFFDVATYQWKRVWSMKGGIQDTIFNHIVIPIDSVVWLTNGFRFRFKNYGSQWGSRNHWHLDYVIAGRAFNKYTISIDDVAWAYKSSSLLKTYTSIPWNHYLALTTTERQALMKDTITLTYTNVNTDAINIRQVSNHDDIYDENANHIRNTPGSNINNLNPGEYKNYKYPLNGWTFPDTVPVSGAASIFEIVDSLHTQPDINSNNDIIRYKQIFKSYYAFDDGTAEAGYSLGQQVNLALAMKFNFLQTDTIRGVQMFFSQMTQFAANDLFRLAIWTSLIPETKIYQVNSLPKNYADTINGFVNYLFTDTDLVLNANQNYYIGLIQNSANWLNLGFDTNTDNISRQYRSIGGGWQQSVIHGTFMIRPLFGDSAIITSTSEIKSVETDIQVYPNPFGTQFTVKGLQFVSTGNIEYKIYDALGSCIKNSKIIVSDDGKISIDMHDADAGIYFITVTDGEKIYSKKLVKM